MRRRALGQTKLKVSELALGTWGLSGDGYRGVPEAEQDRVIDRARALGITLFDTADSYAEGAMERRLGQRLEDDGTTHVITKIGTDRQATPPRKSFAPKYLREAFERSRERLRRKVVDAVLLHNPSLSALERGEATGLLSELKSSKQITAWGVSVSTAALARAAIERAADIIEIPYNVFYANELNELEADMQKSGVGLLAHSVLSYGLLCGAWSSDKEFFGDDHRAERWTPDEFRRRIRQLDAVRPLVGGDVLTMRAGALRYVLSNVRVSSAVLGPRDAVQLDQLVREAGRRPPYLTDEQRFALHARLRVAGVDK